MYKEKAIIIVNSGEKFMMKTLLYCSLLICLLGILENVAFAEDTSLNNQGSNIISSYPVADNPVIQYYHQQDMTYYKKAEKLYWVYCDSFGQDMENKSANDSSASGIGSQKAVQRNEPIIQAAVAQEGTFLKRDGSTMQLDKIDLSKARPRRLEASYSFDYLDPNDIYGDWQSGQFSFYDTVSPDFTYFIQGAGHNRDEGTGATGTVGVYKGWTPFLYTCTSVSAGTNVNYLPKFRVDHDFNFSVWPSQNINFLTGISYIDYFDDHSGWVFSGGPMIAFNKFNMHYRLFYNISNPGSISSFSHLISIGYGQEGWQWTYLNASFGKQAYLATFVVPQEVNQNSLSLNLRHRHWLGKYYGIFGDVSYTKLEDGYDKYGIGLGAFYEF